MTRRFVIVQLADIGDLILSTPALSALREAHPGAHVALLTTAHAAPILPDDLADEVILFDKHTFDRPTALLKPSNLRAGQRGCGAVATTRRSSCTTSRPASGRSSSQRWHGAPTARTGSGWTTAAAFS
jgi:heptosyltransferase-2